MNKDEVGVVFKSGRYHRKIPGQPYKLIPQSLFDTIVIVQTALDSLHQQAKLYRAVFKDKPMRVEKNHTVVAPGEIVKFGTDETDPTI